MKILAILQNQWFKNPEKVKAMFARRPDLRNQYIKSFLFMGCLTGKRLQSVFGKELCNSIVWEEASPEVGGHSSSAFKADLEHIKAALIKHQPDVVLCFGKIAADAVKRLELACKVIYAPHPTSRQDPMKGLREAANQLHRWIASTKGESDETS